MAKWKELAEADEEAKDGRGEGCADESRGSDAKDDQKERREEIARTLYDAQLAMQIPTDEDDERN
jgi:hypothetical protein